MRIIFAFGRSYPARTVLMLLSLLLAGVVESVSLSTMLPLISAMLEDQPHSKLAVYVFGAMNSIGLQPTIANMLVVIVVGMTLSNLLILLGNRQVGYTVAHVATDLRVSLIKALLGSRWEYYLRQPSGALANAVATEAFRASTAYEHAANMLALGIQAAAYALIALFVSWQAAILSLVIGFVLLAAVRGLVKTSRRVGKSQTRLMRELLVHLTDTLGSVKPLKAMARDDIADSLLRRHAGELNTALEREVMSRETLRALQEPMLAILAAAGLYAGLVIGGMPLSSVMVLIFVVVRMLGLLHKAQQRYHRMAAQESAYWAINESIDNAIADAEPRHIAFENISFGYGGRQVLDNVSMNFPVGSFTTMIGPSGSGKTTVLDLICALLAPQSGRIRVDDCDLHALDRKAWRRMIGYVTQETLLLHDSILANVTLGDRALNAADAERALRQAGAWQFVQECPGGLQSIVGERVSHRPAVIRIADQILEVRDGKVLATHHAVGPDGTRADEAKA
eukprot:gene7890-7718_t